MRITPDDRLAEDDGAPVAFDFSPNFTLGLQPKYLLMHYTAGSTAEGAIQWLKNP
jgi:N-acetylmuramoyl-L-alanine amidase